MNAPPETPTLVYDADCGFCVRWVQRWREATGERVEYLASRDVGTRFPHVSADDFSRAVYLFEPDGQTSRGAEAAVRALAAAPGLGRRLPLLAYRRVPGVRPLLDALYGLVARNRLVISRVEHLVAGPDVGPSRWHRSRRMFLAAFGLVALVAMISARVQIVGLAGSDGIVPVAGTLAEEADWLRAPTWLWLDTSDTTLVRLCDLGALGALLVMAGVLPALGALVVWSVALSLVVGVPSFFAYQWDTLLVETSLVAALWAPWHVVHRRRRTPREPSRLARWLVWFVLFRLMFMSGAVKLASDDPSWSALTALHHHYLTQPLPHVVSWFMDKAPGIVHQVGAVFTFVAELVLPITILMPRRLRHAGALGIVVLQALIFATGNFGWFNLLTVVLCASLFDDQWWTRRRRAREAAATRGPAGSCGLEPVELPPYRERRPTVLAQRAAVLLAALVIAPVGALEVTETTRGMLDLPTGPRQPTREQYDVGLAATLVDDGPVAAARLARFHVWPFHSVNGYGLFAVMTTERPEIRVQVADDDGAWHDVAFRHKPHDPARAPTWNQPHMPRLDWQMWFEALAWQRVGLRRPYQPSAWFVGFLEALAAASDDVHGLLAEAPLGGRVPSAIRIRLEYARFTTLDELLGTGHWWRFDPSSGWITTWER